MGAFADQARCAGGNEFLVKGSCGHEILMNNVTGRFFKDGDSCEPEAFREGSSCRDEGVDCVPRKTECSGFKEFRLKLKGISADRICSGKDALLEVNVFFTSEVL